LTVIAKADLIGFMVKAYISPTLSALAVSLLLTAGCAHQQRDASMQIAGRPVTAWFDQEQLWPTSDGKYPAIDALVAAGPQVMPQLTDLLLHDPSAAPQWKAAYAIGSIAYHHPGAPESRVAVPAVASAANSSNIEVRVYAVQALGAIGKAATNTIPLLVRLTRDEDGGVRMSAVASLGRIGIAAPEVVDALQRALSDPSGDVQLTSVHALDAIGQSASNRIPILAQLTSDENSAVRFDAVETLERTGLGSPESVAAIKPALSDSDVGVRSAAEKALRTLQSDQK
jgi:HEAT repeat protein